MMMAYLVGNACNVYEDEFSNSIKNKGEEGWYLEDGFEGKKSTNGTWLFLADYTELNDGDIIKVGQTTLSVKIENQNT